MAILPRGNPRLGTVPEAGGDKVPRLFEAAVGDDVALEATTWVVAVSNRDYEQIAREILEQADAVDSEEDERFEEARGDELPAELHCPRT